MSQGVNNRVASKNQASAFTKKAGTSANIHQAVAYNTMPQAYSTVPAPPSTLPGFPQHTHGQKFLDPAGKEFQPGGAGIAEIINIIKNMYTGPYHCWSKVPQSVRDSWFKEFEKKYWWFPENHSVIRGIFETHACNQLKKLLLQARIPQQRPEWIGKLVWKQLCEHWAAEESKSKTQLNQKVPKIKKNTEKYGSWMVDEEESSQSSMEDTFDDYNIGLQSQNLNIPAEVKMLMNESRKEFHEKVTKLIETVNRAWIRRVESLERERDELKGFVQLYYEYLQNYQDMQDDNNEILQGMSEKFIIKDSSPSSSLPPHRPKAVGSRPPPPPPPRHPNKVSTFRPMQMQPPPPWQNPKVAAFQQPPPQNPNVSTFRPPPPGPYQPNFPGFAAPQPYQPNLSAHYAPPNNSGYGFQGTQAPGQGNGSWNKVNGDIREDDFDDDDYGSEEFSD